MSKTELTLIVGLAGSLVVSTFTSCQRDEALDICFEIVKIQEVTINTHKETIDMCREIVGLNNE